MESNFLLKINSVSHNQRNKSAQSIQECLYIFLRAAFFWQLRLQMANALRLDNTETNVMLSLGCRGSLDSLTLIPLFPEYWLPVNTDVDLTWLVRLIVRKQERFVYWTCNHTYRHNEEFVYRFRTCFLFWCHRYQKQLKISILQEHSSHDVAFLISPPKTRLFQEKADGGSGDRVLRGQTDEIWK